MRTGFIARMIGDDAQAIALKVPAVIVTAEAQHGSMAVTTATIAHMSTAEALQRALENARQHNPADEPPNPANFRPAFPRAGHQSLVYEKSKSPPKRSQLSGKAAFAPESPVSAVRVMRGARL